MIDIVAWSGGYDSTLVLDRLCSAGDKNVWAFALDWDMVNELKRKQENFSRINYKKYAESRGYSFCYNTITISADMSAANIGRPQAMAWLCFISPYLPQESTIHFGYHRGDDFWGSRSLADQLLQSAAVLGERKVMIQYPLELMRKYEIVTEFNQRGISSLCAWSCEDPVVRGKEVRPCGKCTPCISLKLAKYESNLRVPSK